MANEQINTKVLITPKMKILPEMAIGVKKIHAKYFLDQTCSVIVIQVIRFKNLTFVLVQETNICCYCPCQSFEGTKLVHPLSNLSPCDVQIEHAN